MYALLAEERTPNVNDTTEMMLSKGQQEVQAALGCHTFVDHPLFDSAIKATEPRVQANKNPDAQFQVMKGARHAVAACCSNHAEVEADVEAQVLSYTERGNMCLTLHASFGVSSGGIIPYPDV